ncbi:MAG TPA: segregation/condensation protein A [Parcubacteria group bacterium]|jgi:segregation and condensation protein A|nr:segregation/condensation protein A [Parcubacteria group bacterium]
MPDEYLVKTHIFEGPLETLLSLIEKRKLFINDISLAQVADDYIAYVKTLENFPLADSSHFILIASTLVLIKSKSLLPDLQLTPEEQEDIHDLEDRLKQYQKYKALSVHLKERFGIHIEYLRLPSKEKKIVFTPDINTSISKIFETVKSVIQNIPKKEFVPKAIVQKVISLEEMMTSLSERITKSFKMSFKDFSGHGKAEKVNVIVSFLAMLELVKQGIINVRQDADFQDIEMETQSVGVPRY